MLSRTQKRIFISGVYILILVLIVGGWYWSKNRPTCTDGIKNNQEEGVDCGTIACGVACASPIQALVVQGVQLIKTPVGDYDVAFQLYNPNTDYGVDNGSYELLFTDPTGKEITTGFQYPVRFPYYILPGQTKYLVVTALKDPAELSNASVAVKIENAEWIKTNTTQDITFVVTREATTTEANQTTYQAVITNNTNFDFDTIDVSMIVVDGAGVIIATNTTNFQTFMSHTDRSVKVSWPFVLPADARIRTEINTNVFNNANFLKRNGTQEKFQQYY